MAERLEYFNRYACVCASLNITMRLDIFENEIEVQLALFCGSRCIQTLAKKAHAVKCLALPAEFPLCLSICFAIVAAIVDITIP